MRPRWNKSQTDNRLVSQVTFEMQQPNRLAYNCKDFSRTCLREIVRIRLTILNDMEGWSRLRLKWGIIILRPEILRVFRQNVVEMRQFGGYIG